MNSNRKPSVLIESPMGKIVAKEDFELARNICHIATKGGYMPLHASSYLHWILRPTQEDQFSKMYEQMVRGCKPRNFWMVLRDADNRVTKQMLIGLTLAIDMGLHIRYFRTSDNGTTIREVTKFDA